MKNLILGYIVLVILVILFNSNLYVQTKNTLSAIPRIDVHAHVGGIERMADYMDVRKILKEKFNAELAMWVNLQFPLGPRGEVKGKTIKGISLPTDVLEKIYYKNAMKLYLGVKDILMKLGYMLD